MNIEVVFFVRHHGKNTDDPVLHFWTDVPDEPYWLSISPKRTNFPYTVPTKPSAQALMISQYILVHSDEDRLVRTQCGDAIVQAGDFNSNNEATVTLTNEKGDDMGIVKFRIVNDYKLMAGKTFHINSPDTKRRCNLMRDRSGVWHNSRAGGLAPCDPEIEEVYISYLPGNYPHLPGWFFAEQRTTGPESEQFVSNMLVCSARRRCINPQQLAELADRVIEVYSKPAGTYHTPTEEVQTYAYVVAEAIQFVANLIPYETDTSFYNTESETIDHFSTDARVHRSGDCEDLAREIITLANSIREGPAPQKPWENKLNLAAQYVLRSYVTLEVLGAVALKPDKSLSAFSVGEGKKCFAHAWVMMLPTKRVGQMLVHSKSVELDTWSLDPWIGRSLPVLTLDGVRLNDVNAPEPCWKAGHVKLDRAMWDRVRQVERIKGNSRAVPGMHNDYTGYYFAVSCGYSLSALVYKGTKEPVPEVYFINNYNSVKGTTYGAMFEQLHEPTPHLTIEPTAAYVAEDMALAKRCMSFFHPVRAYKEPSSQTDPINITPSALSMYPKKLVDFVTDPSLEPTGKPIRWDTSMSCLLLGCDLEDEDFVKHLKNSLKEYGHKPSNVVPLYCGPESYGVHIEFDSIADMSHNLRRAALSSRAAR